MANGCTHSHSSLYLGVPPLPRPCSQRHPRAQHQPGSAGRLDYDGAGHPLPQHQPNRDEEHHHHERQRRFVPAVANTTAGWRQRAAATGTAKALCATWDGSAAGTATLSATKAAKCRWRRGKSNGRGRVAVVTHLQERRCMRFMIRLEMFRSSSICRSFAPIPAAAAATHLCSATRGGKRGFFLLWGVLRLRFLSSFFVTPISTWSNVMRLVSWVSGGGVTLQPTALVREVGQCLCAHRLGPSQRPPSLQNPSWVAQLPCHWNDSGGRGCAAWSRDPAPRAAARSTSQADSPSPSAARRAKHGYSSCLQPPRPPRLAAPIVLAAQPPEDATEMLSARI